ncbi:MAG: MBL fold metallo-hydrolase [Candidatus Limnocylindrales bacterium]
MGLKLTVLGSSAAWSERPGRPSSCYLLETGGAAMLLDLGQGSLGSVFPHLDPASLEAVVVSHMHGDHHVDLIPLRNLLYYHYGEPRTIFLHLPAGLRRRYDAFTGEDGFLDFMPGHDVHPGTWPVGPFLVQAHPVRHAENSHAFRVTEAADPDGAGLVYSGDCGFAEDLLPLIREGDTVLCEAFWSTLEPIPSANHLSAVQAADVARRGGAAHLLLTHILESHDPQAALAAAKEVFRGTVELAEPELTVAIGVAR